MNDHWSIWREKRNKILATGVVLVWGEWEI